MPKPRTPTALRDVKGMDKKNPSRRNENEPEPTRGIGPAPKHFDKKHQAIWDEIVGISYAGVLGEADRIALEIMVSLLYRFRNATYRKNSKVVLLTGVELGRLSGLISQFGMTPSDRSKINVPKNPAKNGFSGL